MSIPAPRWDPRAPEVLADQPRAYDTMRQKQPVAYSDLLGWSVFSHAEVLQVLQNPECFSNGVSRHRSVPNGMDPPEHTTYRQLVEQLLSEPRIRAFAPVCRRIAEGFAASLSGTGRDRDFVSEFAIGYSLECQCRFVGWPAELTASIATWSERNRAATLSGDRQELASIADEFRHVVARTLAAFHKAAPGTDDDVISGLLRSRIDGKPIDHDDIASILRNWTVGELGSLTAGLSIIVHRLATDESLQTLVREDISLVPAMIDEILRAEGPLVCNRRIARSDVRLGGHEIRAGERVSVMWISANRDETAFERANEIDLARDPRKSLLYGAGIHVCPGASLARMEMRNAIEALLACTKWIHPGSRTPLRMAYPANGYRQLHVRLD